MNPKSPDISLERHRAAARTLPKPKLIIGERQLDAGSGGVFEHVNPATGEAQARVPLAGPQEVDAAVQAARMALPPWRDMRPYRRRVLLDRFAGLIETHFDEFTAMTPLENGICCGTFAVGLKPRVLAWCRYYAGWTDKLDGLVTAMNPGECLEYTLPEPYGVIAHIITWNAPMLSLAMKVLPSIAAGNTVVVKPAEFTPFSSQRFAELALEAGIPPGVINVLPGIATAGAALVKHPGVDKISFTGGPIAARRIMGDAAASLKPVLFELGGKSANVVFPDVDLDETAAYCAAFGLSNNGEGCALPTRLIVHESIYEPFMERLAAAAQALPLGDPLDPHTYIGPMVTQAARERVMGMIEEARANRAGRFLCGGRRLDGTLADGWFVPATVIADIDPNCRIAQEEVFGPVLVGMKFRTEDEAVQLANDTEYGLSAYVQTRDLNIAHRMIRLLEAGTVYVNRATPSANPNSPFGGIGLSGFGREGGRAGLEEFVRLKGVGISIA
ncbi:MAG: aldehyde dehydrogenase family protein [Solimonas sp.]